MQKRVVRNKIVVRKPSVSQNMEGYFFSTKKIQFDGVAETKSRFLPTVEMTPFT